MGRSKNRSPLLVIFNFNFRFSLFMKDSLKKRVTPPADVSIQEFLCLFPQAYANQNPGVVQYFVQVYYYDNNNSF